ncbi:hypothetical protein VNI00_018421 [Paramarasmius palmivorus]|uniref:Uncharacterized protein n=1 Tax=Paramarasmius palmivorus TaxID=297713 RepID=A0AAW0AX47_9AGAR
MLVKRYIWDDAVHDLSQLKIVEESGCTFSLLPVPGHLLQPPTMTREHDSFGHTRSTPFKGGSNGRYGCTRNARGNDTDASGCQVKVPDGGAVLDIKQNLALGDDVANTFTVRYGRIVRELRGIKSASTDFGHVSYHLPALHPGYAIPTVTDGGNHAPMFAASAATEDAHIATLDLAKALALTGVRVIRDDETYTRVKEIFELDKLARTPLPD